MACQWLSVQWPEKQHLCHPVPHLGAVQDFGNPEVTHFQVASTNVVKLCEVNVVYELVILRRPALDKKKLPDLISLANKSMYWDVKAIRIIRYESALATG